MPINVNWQNLRAWSGSQASGFEELCCQLAAHEPQPPRSEFKRKGAPDAGLECFWRLPDGREKGWQCKFFLGPPDDGQWRQIDESVRTALEKHFYLTEMTICLPCDRQDPRLAGRQWFMDRWNVHVRTWQGWAAERGRCVDFHYWGEHEIVERLAREEHRGRFLFWFGRELFSDDWFSRQLRRAIANAGPRYSPQLNVELPISKTFEGLGRTSQFLDEVEALRHSAGTLLRDARPRVSSEVWQPSYDTLRVIMERLDGLLQHGGPHDGAPFDWDAVGQACREADEAIEKCQQAIRLFRDEQKAAHEQRLQSDDALESGKTHYHDDLSYRNHELSKLERKLGEVSRLARSDAAQAFNCPFLLLASRAGKGKTHLLCDAAEKRLREGRPTVLLLGEQFDTSEPWSQITRLLGLSCTPDEFLGALEAAAQARGGRALLIIDALNEGDGKRLWNRHLAGMLETLSDYPHIGLVVSVRTSYEELVVPDALRGQSVEDQKFLRIEHEGFTGHEYEATKTFFAYYGLQRPSVPFLNPEFQDPLFLRLFCAGLKNENMTQVPAGFHGVTRVFSFFLDSVNKKLARPEHLDFDVQARLVQQAVDTLIARMAKTQGQWLSRDEAQSLVNVLLPRDRYEDTLFRHLLVEGVLAEEMYPGSERNSSVEGVRLGFERLSDHLLAQHYLDASFDADDPRAAFAPGGGLNLLFSDNLSYFRQQGLVEALSVQVPERCGEELAFLLPNEHQALYPVRMGFLDALLWRVPSSITENTKRYINEVALQDESDHERLLDIFLTLAAHEDHPFNADFLHRHLMRFEMADRDAWWSRFLHEQHENRRAVDRLLEWAWSGEDKSHVSDESLRLCSVALAWFLTTPNRFVRDKATKAIVALLAPRLHLVAPLLSQFQDVNDLYVSERLYAIACGAAMRSRDNAALEVLAREIYVLIFSIGEPVPHLLLRDYARQVIELALSRGLAQDTDTSRVRPPYGSSWPETFPSQEEVERYKSDDVPSGMWHIYHSVIGNFGDFGRYDVDNSLGDRHWSSRRLGAPIPPTREARYSTFVESLTPRQRQAFETYGSVYSFLRELQRRPLPERMETLEKVFKDLDEAEPPASAEELEELATDDGIETTLEDYRQAFFGTLRAKKRAAFESEALPYIEQPWSGNTTAEDLDTAPIQRWIVQKVFDFGWTKERFGHFDQYVNYQSGDRTAHKAERVGKKYQWLALHEIAARLADNFVLKADDWYPTRAGQPYEGPWQPGMRDIDPSLLLSRTQADVEARNWWSSVPFDEWRSEPDDLRWIERTGDLPPLPPLVEVINPADGSRWLVLKSYMEWLEPLSPGRKKYDSSDRRLCFWLKSYLVQRSGKQAFWEWAKQQNLNRGQLPESYELHQMFWGELFWSPAFHAQKSLYYGRDAWITDDDRIIPTQLLVTNDEYAWEGGDIDCSLEESVRFHLPNAWIVEQMGLHVGTRDGSFEDPDGNLITFDPSTLETGPSALLVNREALLSFLEAHDCDIVWVVAGEKQVFSRGDYFPGRLEVSGVMAFNGEQLEVATSYNVLPPRGQRPRNRKISGEG